MQELLTPQQTEELLSGRLYIMDYSEPKPQDEPPEDIPEDIPEAVSKPPAEHSEPTYERAVHRAYRRNGSPLMPAAAAVGVLIGVITALFFPLTGGDFLSGVAASAQGGFAAALLRRLGQVGIFLLAEFLLGYFAAGRAVVWIAPLMYGLSAGLTSAGVSAAGGSAFVILPELLYTAVITVAANTSGEMSELLLRLVSGESGSVVTRGRASKGYDLQFAVYALVILAVAIGEAAVKTA